MAYKEHINEAVALLRKLISTPSVSRDETEAADILHDFMTDKGLSPTRVSNNVWAQSSRWNDDWPTILLNAHIDTVKPVPALMMVTVFLTGPSMSVCLGNCH